jgi:xanthine/CO dehydrogenase XdhC/CoxF family maturation factor
LVEEMQNLYTILKEAKKLKKHGVEFAIATVVKTSGSTYRRPGARMLITKNGRMIGSISGGCLEEDIKMKAKGVIKQGIPVLAEYDTSSYDDVILGSGLGCGGIVHVLIEKFSKNEKLERTIEFMMECVDMGKFGAVATVFKVDGQLNVKISDRMIFRSSEVMATDIKEPELQDMILKDCRDILDRQESRVKFYRLPRGGIEVLFETIYPPVELMIFGSGPDVIPVVRIAKEIGWRAIVVDSRPEYTKKKRFPQADSVILSHPEDILKNIKIKPRSIAIIMTHNYFKDRELLKQLLPSPVKYIGILGPRRRTEQLLDDIKSTGMEITRSQIERLYSPTGLDIGAETPEEIALSIIAEIQSVITGRRGGMLRDKKGSIH